MSVQGDLEKLKYILERLADYPDCEKICGYSGWQIKEIFMQGMDKVVKRYKSEAARVRKYTRDY